MVKKSRASVMGLTKLKNKVNRNAFDLSHRHMFTAQPGELLPIFYQWVNPNESFKIGYNGMTRTAPLNTAAFTRLRENVQYFFVPFQCLWRYFEQVVNNMPSGQAGQDISMLASGPSDSQKLSTSLPYVNYADLEHIIQVQYDIAVDAVVSFLKSTSTFGVALFYDYCTTSLVNTGDLNEHFNSVFFNREYRYVATGKLLNSLGYGNFSKVITHDVYSQVLSYMEIEHIKIQNLSSSGFLASQYALKFQLSVSTSVPNLSVLPLLAYHKIVNDFYRLRNWQSYQSWTSNIDYITPSSNMDFMSNFNDSMLTNKLAYTIFDLEYSNLPIDYFTGVLPRAQYGDESAVPLSASTSSSASSFSNLEFKGTNTDTNVTLQGSTDHLQLKNGSNILQAGSIKLNGGSATISSDLKISSLRSAIALQKYKEIQNSNDWSFEEQVLAHFGVKPSCDIHKSRFIGGSDSTIDINPQVNQALFDGAMPEIKAIGTGTLSCNLNFKSDTYGIIIGIYRCVPQLDYAHCGIDRNLYKTDASDFPLPELDSIGMQSQYRTEVFAHAVGVSDANVDFSPTYGFAPRYAELKTSYDRYDGGFFDAYSSWVTGLDTHYFEGWLFPTTSGFKLDVTDLLLCSPSLLYPIFVNQWSGTANDDKLLIGSVNSCVAVRPFSVHGLPWSN